MSTLTLRRLPNVSLRKKASICGGTPAPISIGSAGSRRSRPSSGRRSTGSRCRRCVTVSGCCSVAFVDGMRVVRGRGGYDRVNVVGGGIIKKKQNKKNSETDNDNIKIKYTNHM